MKKIDTSRINNWPEGVLLAVSEIHNDVSPEILSSREMEEYDSFANSRRKNEYLIGRYLFQFLLKDWNINPKEVELFKEEKGKPYALHGGELINVSFTHSPDLVMCAISRERKIGIDTESSKRSIDQRVVKRILNEKEWEVIGHEDPLKLWTIKEAALKCS
ncbi:MAG: 4'-phosphopantetheinyl transferase superfamily protein, partial [Balneolaceae bacterium]